MPPPRRTSLQVGPSAAEPEGLDQEDHHEAMRSALLRASRQSANGSRRLWLGQGRMGGPRAHPYEVATTVLQAAPPQGRDDGGTASSGPATVKQEPALGTGRASAVQPAQALPQALMESRKYERLRMQALLAILPDNRATAAIRVLRQDDRGHLPPVVWRTRPLPNGPLDPQARERLLGLAPMHSIRLDRAPDAWGHRPADGPRPSTIGFAPA